MDAIDTRTIDASGRSLGRVASEAAKILMGKTSPSYTANRDDAPRVVVTNAGKITISERKLKAKRYTSYSGYPGGLRTERLRDLAARSGKSEAVRRAIERMLPRNALRKDRMMKLTITE